jgi:fructose-specific component phosphotransferase system IIB-like protein
MTTGSPQRDPLAELHIFDPDTAELVLAGIERLEAPLLPDALGLLVDETIRGLTHEVSFGRAVAGGFLSLIECADMTVVRRYCKQVRAAGRSGPTLGRLVATHLAPILATGDSRLEKHFLQAVRIMEGVGTYTLTKPLATLKQILEAGDRVSAIAYLELLGTTFSKPLSYNQSQHFAYTLPRAARRFAPAKRVWQLQQLRRVMQIDNHLADAFLDGLEKGLQTLSGAALHRFVARGLEKSRHDMKTGRRFFALISKTGQDAFADLQVAVAIAQVRSPINRYLRARTGRSLSIRPLSALSDSSGPCSDGRYIYLPDEISRFERKSDNLKLYKCLARFESGYYEFDTYNFDLERLCDSRGGQIGRTVGGDDRKPTGSRSKAGDMGDLEQFFHLFSEPDLAADLFMIFEHGRIRHLFAHYYPGLIKTYLPVLQAEMQKIMDHDENSLAFSCLYAQIALDMQPSDKVLRKAGAQRRRRPALALFRSAMQHPDPTAELSAELVLDTYSDMQSIWVQSRESRAGSGYKTFPTPFDRRMRSDLHHFAHLNIDRMAGTIKHKLEASGFAVYKSAIKSQLSAGRGEFGMEDIEEILRHPENYCARARPDGEPAGVNQMDIIPPVLSQLSEMVGRRIDTGDNPVCWYPEWDCHLGDYLNHHTRVIDRKTSGPPSDIYENILQRGQSLDGLDKKAGRTPSQRLYLKRFKERRDVAVLLLVDISRSTAHGVCGSDATVLELEKEAIVLFSEALETVGDTYAIAGFSGSSRLGVDFFHIKDFDEPMAESVRRRIGAMTPQRNTRMGAAIRHAARQLSAVPSRVRLLIILGDGFPNDLDYKQAYAIEDTRKAISELRCENIHVHAITVNIHLADYSRLDKLYGDIHHNVIAEVSELPDKLCRIYGALTG